MIDFIDLARRLAGKNVTDDSLMPEAYRAGARPLHDDWGLWPFTLIPRKATWYRLPLPYRAVSVRGMAPSWIAWQEGYPEAPEAQFRPVKPGTAAWDLKTRFGKPIEREVLAYDTVPQPGGEGLFAVWLDNEWRECYYTNAKVISVPFLGRRIVKTNRILKCDLTYGDFGCQFPDASFTVTKEAA